MGGEYFLLLIIVTSSFLVGSLVAGFFGSRVLQLQFKGVVAIALLSFGITFSGFSVLYFQGRSWAVWQFLLGLFITQLLFQYFCKCKAFSPIKSIVIAMALAFIPSSIVGVAIYAF